MSNILAYPPEVKERIYLDAYKRLSYMPTLTAKQIPDGTLKGYWVRLGLHQAKMQGLSVFVLINKHYFGYSLILMDQLLLLEV
nr:hypothetical protein [Bacillus piscicola]